jgi:hypothetical protein
MVFFLFGCETTPTSNVNDTTINISVNLDPSVMSNDGALASWMGYAIVIASEMDSFYKNNPSGNFILTFDIEYLARESMIELYLDLKNNQGLENEYQFVEELIIIQNANYLREYVFFTFNRDTWINSENLVEENFLNWMRLNLPEHNPVTLASIRRD